MLKNLWCTPHSAGPLAGPGVACLFVHRLRRSALFWPDARSACIEGKSANETPRAPQRTERLGGRRSGFPEGRSAAGRRRPWGAQCGLKPLRGFGGAAVIEIVDDQTEIRIGPSTTTGPGHCRALMGIDQPRVSALLNGRRAKFSSERLARW